MRKIIFVLSIVLAAFNAYADRMYIDNFSIEAGETKQVSIKLDNSSALTAFQLEMYLPEGLSMALDSRGRLRCGVNADRADDHTLTFKDRGNGQYNAVYYSNNSYEIYGNSGEIVYFYVTAADNFSGTATIELKEVYVSDPQGRDTKLDNSSCTVTGPNPVNPPVSNCSMGIDDFTINAGETKQVGINLNNDIPLTAFQLEMYLPEGLTMSLDSRDRLRCGVNADRADDHTVTFKDRGNGQYNAVYYSNNSYEIYGNSGEIVYFYVTAADNFSGTATIELKEVYVSDPQGKDTKLANSSCTVTGVIPVVKATSVSLDKNTATLTTGETTTLTATVLPENATDKSVTWTSSNSAVATVASGKVTAVAPGTTTVTVKTADGSNLTTTCFVTVKAPVVKATSVSLDKNTVTLTTGETTTLTATVLPENATDKSVTWTSSNSAVATVTNGKVTAVSPGTATVTVKTADGSNLTATCSVTVKAPVVKATSVSLDKNTVTLTTGETTTLTATVLPENATDKSVTWTSSNSAVATVTNGKVTAVAPGTAIVTVKTADGSNLTTTCEITVKRNEPAPESFTLDGIAYKQDGSGGVIVTYTEKNSTDNYKGLKVANIPANVTVNNQTFSVVGIDELAFKMCGTLTSVNIPKSVASIGNDAFSGCETLSSITVDAENETYDSRGNCNAVIETATNTLVVGCMNSVIPGGITKIGFAAFSECKGLTEIKFPISVTTIDRYAFYRCTGLTSLNIHNNITSIGSSAFAGCGGLTKIAVNALNPVYDSRNNCNALIETATDRLILGSVNTVIPDNVTAIGSSAFYGCAGLKKIEIPSSVKTVGSYAFYECTGAASAVINDGVTSLGGAAFQGCAALKYVYIGNSVTSIAFNAFLDCENIAEVHAANPKPATLGSDAFAQATYANAPLYVKVGSVDTYKAAAGWKNFAVISEDFKPGDVNGDGEVDITDVNIIINIMLGKEDSGKYNGRADLTGDGDVDVSDVNAAINKLLGK